MMLVLGTPLALLGLGFVAAAAGAGWLHFQQRDDGFFTSPTERFETSSNAITSLGLEIIVGRRLPDFLPSDTAGSILLRGAPVTTGKDIFLGVAPQQEVSRYLDGVRRSEITELDLRPFRVEYRDIPGTRTPARPGAQTFWTATATGPGSQELRWDLQPGNWAIVVMNADGSAPLAADLQGRIRSDLLWPLFLVLLLAGIVLLAIGVPLIIAAARAMGPPPHHPPTPGPPAAVPGASGSPYYTGTAGGSAAGSPAGGGARSPPPPSAVGIFSNAPYPARLDGYLDPALSRWMWLVKWFLALPHLIVLFFLWFALIVTSIVAWFAILFTARYPPFTLARTDYPADFDVDYPERLSRGLVLVKSWLLAIPHLLIVGVLAGTTRTWGGVRRRVVRLRCTLRRRGDDLPDRSPGPHRRGHPAFHWPVPPQPVRPAARPEPLGVPGDRIRGSHARRVSALPP